MPTWRASETPSALEARDVAVAGGLEHDLIEAAVEAQEAERGRRGLARPLTVGRQPHALGAQRREQGRRAGIAPQVHARVVVVEARELEPPRADLGARPGLEHGDGRFAGRHAGDVELADRGEAAREVLECERPDGIAAGRDRALGEDESLRHAVSSRSRVRVAASAATAMPMPSIATSCAAALRPGTNDWCHSSLTA